MDGGSQAITNAAELAAVRRQARGVIIKATGLALLLMALTLAI